MYYLSKKVNHVLDWLQKVKRVLGAESISFSKVLGVYRLGWSMLLEVSASVDGPRVAEDEEEKQSQVR